MTTNISTSFPDLLLPPGITITVDSGDNNAIISKLNVYGATPIPTDTAEAPADIPPLFVYGPNE